VDIQLPTHGKFPHYAFYPPFHSTFPQFPFHILPSSSTSGAFGADRLGINKRNVHTVLYELNSSKLISAELDTGVTVVCVLCDVIGCYGYDLNIAASAAQVGLVPQQPLPIWRILILWVVVNPVTCNNLVTVSQMAYPNVMHLSAGFVGAVKWPEQSL